MFTAFGPWLAAIVGPLAKKVMLALGLGVVTYVGLDAAINTALDAAKSSFGAMPTDVALLVARFGFFQYMSITTGAVVSGMAWIQLKRLAMVNGS